VPYATNNDLPPSVREHLPSPAQEIFRKAFNQCATEAIAPLSWDSAIRRSVLAEVASERR
jgi:cation transport regulator